MASHFLQRKASVSFCTLCKYNVYFRKLFIFLPKKCAGSANAACFYSISTSMIHGNA